MLVAGSLFAEKESVSAEKTDGETRSSGAAVQQTRRVLRETYAFAPAKTETPVAVTRSTQPRLAPGWDIIPEKPKSGPSPEAEKDTEPGVVKLDPLIVEERAVREAEQERALIEARRERVLEKLESVEDSALDDILNPARFSILGPYSKANRLSMGRAQLDQLELEDKLVSLIDATTDASERAALRRFLMEVRYGRKMK